MLTTEQKLLAIASHLGWLTGLPVLIPIIILLLSKDDFVKYQAKEALSFQLGVVVAGIASALLAIVLIGFVTGIIVGIMALIFPFVATVRVINGEAYSYPITGKYIASKI